MASFRVQLQSSRIDCSIKFFNEKLYRIISSNLLKDVDADGRWFVAVGALSFPTYSHVWDVKIIPYRGTSWHTEQTTRNLMRASDALQEICEDFERLHEHLIKNDEIGEQLHVLPDARICAALTMALFLNRPEKIEETLLNYKNAFMPHGTAERIIQSAKTFLIKAHENSFLDEKTLKKALEFH